MVQGTEVSGDGYMKPSAAECLLLEIMDAGSCADESGIRLRPREERTLLAQALGIVRMELADDAVLLKADAEALMHIVNRCLQRYIRIALAAARPAYARQAVQRTRRVAHMAAP